MITECCIEMCVMNSSKVYTAKENKNITIEWSTQMKTDWTLINMICEFYSDNLKILYETMNGSSKSPDEQFVGRVHLDIDAPREAKIRLHLSRLKTKDSGNYCCLMNANYDSVTKRWRLRMRGLKNEDAKLRFQVVVKREKMTLQCFFFTECFNLNVTTGGNNNPSNIATTAGKSVDFKLKGKTSL
ncbi:hypothetical protein GOODEAATRI_027122 [Goodea atripinnis]|uniref:Ig-like domain-containing protein n=1 Tax=Goodea atripinnis TaxID=208336 RepID=A0ABV0Q1G9_9TELE